MTRKRAVSYTHLDLNEVAAEIRKLQSEIKDIDAELKPFFDELGLDFPFDVEGK